ncbi:hypothetical protein [Agrobacterium sp. SORGH_AS 787]|uniref:hypothetical protein n=1 Tax=Agrobacterium sp. SORGH_AS 787 TaxID=3041775 RepID=UPI0032B80438
MPSGQSLSDNQRETCIGWLVGTSDLAATNPFESLLEHLLVGVRGTQRIRKHNFVYSYNHLLDQRSSRDYDSASLRMFLEKLEDQLAGFVVPLTMSANVATNQRKKIAIYCGDAPQFILEVGDAAEEDSSSQESAWVRSTRSKLEIGNNIKRVEDIADIISSVESQLIVSKHDEVSVLFASINTQNIPVVYLIGLLRITFPCRDLITSWSKLLMAAKGIIELEGRDSEKVLRGLFD